MKKLTKTLALTFFAVLPASTVLAIDEHFTDGEVVVGGYDVVAYHTVGEPTKGTADFSATYQGATWYFASAETLEMFEADPARYAPAYGGWCSAGASKGVKVPTQPDLWAIVDGQLYLNSSPVAHNDLFLADTETVISKGESFWKQIFATPANEL